MAYEVKTADGMVLESENIEMVTLMPQHPHCGEEAWMLLKFSNGAYRLFRTKFIIKDSGDMETGPIPYVTDGDWIDSGCGQGQVDLEKLIAQVKSGY